MPTPPRRTPPGHKPVEKPSPAPDGTAKPKKKLELDVNDVDSILERKISP